MTELQKMEAKFQSEAKEQSVLTEWRTLGPPYLIYELKIKKAEW